MAAAMMVSVNSDALVNSGCMGGPKTLRQELSQTLGIGKDNFLRSLCLPRTLSEFPPVNSLSAGRTILTGGNRGLEHPRKQFPEMVSRRPPPVFSARVRGAGRMRE